MMRSRSDDLRTPHRHRQRRRPVLRRAHRLAAVRPPAWMVGEEGAVNILAPFAALGIIALMFLMLYALARLIEWFDS